MGNTHRQCAVVINNESKNYTLQNAKVYINSGCCQNSLKSTGPDQKSSALFKKTPYTACGSVGVFTYDLHNKSTNKVKKKMAVMFSNPYDFSLNSNLYAVGIFDEDQPCDHSLYYKMYYDTGKEFVRRAADPDPDSVLTHEEDGVIISAKMTDTEQPNLKITISSRDASAHNLIYKGNGVIISANMTDTHQPELDVKISSRNDSWKKMCCIFSCLTSCCTESPNE